MATDLRKRGIRAVPDGLDPELEDYLKDVHRLFRQVLDGSLGSTTVVADGTGSPSPGPAGPPGPPGAPAPGTTPDLTPPPTPSSLSATAGFANIFVQWDVATYTQGHGNLQTNIYGAKYPGTGPLPTFGDAVLVGVAPQPDTIFVLPTELSTQWHIWIKFQTRDDVESVSQAGGANGAQATTGKIGNADLGPLIIEAGNLATGAVTTAKFAAGIEPVAIVGALPSPSGYTGPKTVFLTTDGKLYRYASGAWTAAIPATDINGQIVGTQIADNSISTPKLQANSVVAGKIAAAAVSATEIAANAIQAVHLAANSIAVGTAAIQNGALVNAMIANATIDDAKIASLSVSKLTAAALSIGSYIQSNDYVSGVSGWRISGNGFAELGAAAIRGQLTASQINGNGLVIRDLAGVPILGVGNGLQASYLAAVFGGGNVLRNSAFVADSLGSGVPDNWASFATGSTGAVSHTRPATGGPDGGPYVNVTCTALGASGSDRIGWYHNGDVPISLPATGGPVTMSAYLQATPVAPNSQMYFFAEFETSGGTLISVDAKQFPAATGWKRYSATFTAPAGAAKMFVYIWQWLGNGTAASFSVAKPQLEAGDVLSAWAPSSYDKVGVDNRITSANVSTYIASAAIGSAYISDLSAGKITAGNIQAGGYIRSTSYTPGVSGWSVNADGTAEFGAASIRGTLSASNIVGAAIKSSLTGTPLTVTAGEVQAQAVLASSELILETPNVGDSITASAVFNGELRLNTSAFGGSGANYFWSTVVDGAIQFWNGSDWISNTDIGATFFPRFVTFVVPSDLYRIPINVRMTAIGKDRTLQKARVLLTVSSKFSVSASAGGATANVISIAVLVGEATIQQFPN